MPWRTSSSTPRREPCWRDRGAGSTTRPRSRSGGPIDSALWVPRCSSGPPDLDPFLCVALKSLGEIESNSVGNGREPRALPARSKGCVDSPPFDLLSLRLSTTRAKYRLARARDGDSDHNRPPRPREPSRRRQVDVLHGAAPDLFQGCTPGPGRQDGRHPRWDCSPQRSGRPPIVGNTNTPIVWPFVICQDSAHPVWKSSLGDCHFAGWEPPASS